MIDQDLPPAIFLMGPTASGKTALAVEIAQNLGAEIISVDSALVYQGMDIGTAKPSMNERGGIKHHLIDILDPAESFSTAITILDHICQHILDQIFNIRICQNRRH